MEWHFSFPLMNSFNKTEAAIFDLQSMLPEEFPFSNINLTFFVGLNILINNRKEENTFIFVGGYS